MGKKQKLTLSVDEELVRKGRELGFNFSKLLERVLKEEIRLHERAFMEKEDRKWSGGQDLNLRHSGFCMYAW